MHYGHPRTLPLRTPIDSRQVDNRSGRVRRVSVRETSGTDPAVFRLWDGTADNGALLDSISLSPGQSTRDYYRIGEYPYDGGLFLEVVSGQFEGTIVVQQRVIGEPEAPVMVMVDPTVLVVDFETH